MHANARRAITLAGGGPEAALLIGALAFFEREAKVRFDIWALSCIGAWVGIYYQQCEEGTQAEQTKKFFRERIYRENISYSRFPINGVFGPDIGALGRATIEFLLDVNNYRNIVLPGRIMGVVKDSFAFVGDTKRWNEGDFNKFLLEFLAAHPYSRFLTSLMYLSKVNGLSKIYYEDSSFLKSINFDALSKPGKPFIFHNAFNLNTKQIQLFGNRSIRDYKPITAQSLCACSALPYIEGTITFDGSEYCEGALVDTVNFKNLLEDAELMLGNKGAELDEVWVCKIVDDEQIRAPRNLCDALGNLCMLFAATVGDDDIKLFRYHARLEKGWCGQIVELEFGAKTNFDWSQQNFDDGFAAGWAAAQATWENYNRRVYEIDRDSIINAQHHWSRRHTVPGARGSSHTNRNTATKSRAPRAPRASPGHAKR
jgi:predicted acylesterase/phospholipase RssA